MFKEIGAAAWERRILSSNSHLTLDSESEAMRVHVNLSEEDLTAEARNLELRVLDMMVRDRRRSTLVYRRSWMRK